MFGSKTVIGLDIGSHSVKAIQLRKRGSKFELERLGTADVYPHGEQGNVTTDPRELLNLKVQAVRRALEQGGITAKHCAVAISGESIIIRYIQLPQMPENELKNALRWEAEEYIPYRIEEVNIDSAILGPSTTAGKIDVVLVCAKKDMVDEHLAVVQAVGLTPVIVDVDSFAFMNSFEALCQPAKEECIALVNLGAENTNINIYVGGTSRFSRDINVAGNSVARAVAQKSGVAFANAEEVMKTVGAPVSEEVEEEGDEEESSLISSIRGTVERITGSDLGDDSMDVSMQKAIGNVLESLAGEISRSIQFFENQAGGASVQRMVLGGGLSKMPNLSAYMKEKLEIDVQLFDPLVGLTVASPVNQQSLQAYKEHLGVGIGLALRKAV